jgi:peptide/nickel transport system substrate-binding protein
MMNDLNKYAKRTLLITVCLLVLLAPFYAAPSSVQATAQFQGRYGGTLRVGYPAGFRGWGVYQNYRSPSAYIHQQVYNNIYTYDDLYNVNGDLMKGVPQVEKVGDNWVWTMELEHNIRWHDGVPLTAEDIVFTYETICFGGQDRDFVSDEINERLELPTPYSTSYFRNLIKIEQDGMYKVKFTFTEELSQDWVTEWHSNYSVLPKHLWKDFNRNNPPGQQMEDNRFNTEAIGSGPFKLSEWEPEQFVILDRNDDYFRGIPYLENIIFTVIPDPAAQVLALENGEIDTIHEQANYPQAEINRVNALPEFSVDGFPYTTTWRVRLNQHPDGIAKWPWLGDVNVRYAMEYAINKQGIVDTILNGITKVTDTPISWIVAPYGGDYNTVDQGYTGDWPIVKRTYDPDMARTLLEEAGWTLNADGVRHKVIDGVDYLCSGGEMPYYAYATSWAEAIQQNWQDVGIWITPVPMESATFFDGVEISETGLQNENLGGPWPASLNTMGAGPDPDNIRDWLEIRSEYPYTTGGENFGWYINERVDELLQEGRYLSDYSVRKPIYDEIQYLVHQDCPLIFLWNKWKIEAWNNDFAGFGSMRPIAWFGCYFRGNQTTSNIERGVYWRGGSVNPEGDQTTIIQTTTQTTATTVPEFSLKYLAAFASILFIGMLVYRRKLRRR